MTISEEKKRIRNKILKKLKEQSEQFRSSKSKTIVSKLRTDSLYRKSQNIMFYVSMDYEVDTHALLRESLLEGKCVTVPYVDREHNALIPVQIKQFDEHLVSGSYNILEPKKELIKPFDVGRLELILVPGIAFDRKYHRLGRGGGYYDRFLATVPAEVKRYGLAFDFQLFDSIPVESFDVPMNEVITNS